VLISYKEGYRGQTDVWANTSSIEIAANAISPKKWTQKYMERDKRFGGRDWQLAFLWFTIRARVVLPILAKMTDRSHLLLALFSFLMEFADLPGTWLLLFAILRVRQITGNPTVLASAVFFRD